MQALTFMDNRYQITTRKTKITVGQKGTVESIHGFPGLIMKADSSDSLSLLYLDSQVDFLFHL